MPPAETIATPLARPATSTGIELFAMLALPSWPLRLRPQHFRPPAVVTAQVCEAPAEIEATPLVRPVTSTGVGLFAVLPLPS